MDGNDMPGIRNNAPLPTDGEILRLLRRGDEQAVAYMFDRYYAMLCRFAKRILNDARLAEEVVDDVMFGVWQRRAALADDSTLQALLVCSVRNRSLNELRGGRCRPTVCLSVISNAENLAFLDCIFADPRHPLGQLIELELERDLQRSIDSLPRECREVFRRVRVEARSYDEVARELGISVNTVKYHMKNALATLRQRFGNYLEAIIAMCLLAN